LKNEQVLTKELIETLIEKIHVYPGKRVEVLFTYSDALMLKPAAAMADKPAQKASLKEKQDHSGT